MSSTSTATPAKHAFEARVVDVRSNKSDINALILDYLTMEGYTKAAEKFSKEANLQPQQDTTSIQARQEIQHYIHVGRIQDAVEALNDIDPEIIDTDSALHFALLRLQLLELIRSYGEGGDILPAMEFAQTQVAPRAVTDKAFLEDLEKTMALLIFPKDGLTEELAALLHPDLRREVADKVNKAILDKQTQRREAAIRNLVKMRAWAEKTMREGKHGKDLPERLDLGLNGDEHDAHDGLGHENGHEPMITT